MKKRGKDVFLFQARLSGLYDRLCLSRGDSLSIISTTIRYHTRVEQEHPGTVEVLLLQQALHDFTHKTLIQTLCSLHQMQSRNDGLLFDL